MANMPNPLTIRQYSLSRNLPNDEEGVDKVLLDS